MSTNIARRDFLARLGALPWLLTTTSGKAQDSTRRIGVITPMLAGFTPEAGFRGRLRDLGYEVLIVWECDARDDIRLREILAAFFGGLSLPGENC